MKTPISQLYEHPENHLFHNLPDEDLQALAEDMQVNGMIHAVVARKADGGYQIISGHQRVRAAKKLGWSEIEATVIEADDNQAARMLIAANIKTRTLSPMELARAIRRERELIEQTYGNRERKRTDLTAGHNVPQLPGRWSQEIADEQGKDEKTVRRLDKLNDLIPELQHLVDSRELGATAAEQLAYLEPATQQALFDLLGEEISQRTVSEVKTLRDQLQVAQKADRETAQIQQELATLKQAGRAEDRQQIARLETEIQRLQSRSIEQVEVVPDAVKQELQVWKNRISEMEAEKREKEEELRKAKLSLELKEKGYDFLAKENSKLEKEVERLQAGVPKIITAEEQKQIKAAEEWQREMTRIERQQAINKATIAFTAEISKIKTEEQLADTIQALAEIYQGRESTNRAIANFEHAVLVLNKLIENFKKNQNRLEVVTVSK